LIHGIAAAVQRDDSAGLRSFEEALVRALGQIGFCMAEQGDGRKLTTLLRELTSDFYKGVVHLGLG
jgi:hypothetical protein